MGVPADAEATTSHEPGECSDMNSGLPVLDAYERWACDYDIDPNRTRDLDAAALRAAGLPLEGAVVVEFGAGTGKNSVFLASLARRLIALDFSPAMLARARAKVPAQHVSFVEHDVTRVWPVPGAGADVVVGSLVLEHVEHLEPVFREAARALRVGGTLYVCELHPYRQLGGSQARFTAPDGETRIAAYLHSTAEYIMAAVAAGFRLDAIAEPADATPPPGQTAAMPRLLQLRFVKDDTRSGAVMEGEGR